MNRKNFWFLIGIFWMVATLCSACGVEKLTAVKETEEAASAYDSAEQLTLGAQYLEEIRYEEALAVYNQILQVAGEEADAYLGIAEVYIRQGKYDTALEYAQKGYERTKDNRLLMMTEMIESGNIVDSKNRILRETAYDENGKVQWWHDFTYNELWQQNSITAYDKNGTVIRELELTYDNAGNQVSGYWEMRNPGDELDGYIAKTEAEWKDGLLIKEVCYGFCEDFTSSTDCYEYDSNGNVTRKLIYHGDNENPSSEAIYYYDEKDLLQKIEYKDCYEGEEDDMHTDIYYYDKNGLCVRINTYDANNKLERYELYEYHEDGESVQIFLYDADGNLQQVIE